MQAALSANGHAKCRFDSREVDTVRVVCILWFATFTDHGHLLAARHVDEHACARLVSAFVDEGSNGLSSRLEGSEADIDVRAGSDPDQPLTVVIYPQVDRSHVAWLGS